MAWRLRAADAPPHEPIDGHEEEDHEEGGETGVDLVVVQIDRQHALSRVVSQPRSHVLPGKRRSLFHLRPGCVVAHGLNGEPHGGHPRFVLHELLYHFESVRPLFFAEKERKSVQLEENVEHVKAFGAHVERVEVIAELAPATQMLLGSREAVGDFPPSRQTHEQVELIHEIKDDVDPSVFADFHLGYFLGGGHEAFDLDSCSDGERVPNKERGVEE